MLYVDLIGGQRLEMYLHAQKLPLTGKHSLNDLNPDSNVRDRAEEALKGKSEDRARAVRELTMLAVRLGLVHQQQKDKYETLLQ